MHQLHGVTCLLRSLVERLVAAHGFQLAANGLLQEGALFMAHSIRQEEDFTLL